MLLLLLIENAAAKDGASRRKIRGEDSTKPFFDCGGQACRMISDNMPDLKTGRLCQTIWLQKVELLQYRLSVMKRS